MSPELRKLAWDTAQIIMNDKAGRMSRKPSTAMAEHIEAAFQRVGEMAIAAAKADVSDPWYHPNIEYAIRAMFEEKE